MNVSTGVSEGPLSSAIDELLATDLNAMWDSTANAGRGGVINSAFAQSPRVIALPVFAPDAYGVLSSGSAATMDVVKIVGFFVSHRVSGTVHGYLLGWSQLVTSPVTARPGEWAPLSASFTGPGSPVVGVPIEFLVNDIVVATAQSDGTGTAYPPTLSFNAGSMAPGNYPSAIRVRMGAGSGFFVADDATADLTILKNIPAVTWSLPGSIVYGTPLSTGQLSATANVPGEFVYSPAEGVVLRAGENQLLSVTFRPADVELYEEVTATAFLNVVPAPLTISVASRSKLYLDPLPAFTFTAAGFVAGDTPSTLLGTPTFQTTATDSSPVGTYPVNLSGLTSPDYALTYQAGTLTITPQSTITGMLQPTPNPSTYGQPIAVTVTVTSGTRIPTGTVRVLTGATVIGIAALINGQAMFSLTSLNAGAHTLSAEYPGDGGFGSSASSALQQSVVQASTQTTLTASPNPSRTAEPVTLTAVVRPVSPGGGVPAGSVEFRRAGSIIAIVGLTNGSAVLTTSTLPAGKHQLQARYVGTVNYGGSVSPVVQQTVKGGGK